MSPNCPEDAAAALLLAFHEEPGQVPVAEETDGRCGWCGMLAACLCVHRVHRCPAAHALREFDMGAAEAIMCHGARPTTRVQQVWNGMKLLGQSVAVCILWAMPWRATRARRRAGIILLDRRNNESCNKKEETPLHDHLEYLPVQNPLSEQHKDRT